MTSRDINLYFTSILRTALRAARRRRATCGTTTTAICRLAIRYSGSARTLRLPTGSSSRNIHSPFHLISDPDCVILKAYEAWGLKKLYGKESWGTLRTTYVIDGDGIITDAIGKVNTKDHTSQILGEE